MPMRSNFVSMRFRRLIAGLLGLSCSAFTSASHKLNCARKLLNACEKPSDPVTGKSRLPWFDYVFYNHGTRVTNFYVRGMSLSAPSWSLVDTGQHLQIKGNVEFDRTTLHTYDYLNALSFYLKQAGRGNVDMPGTEVLDSVGVPILMDAYENYQRLPGSQLYGRGARIMTLINTAQSKFLSNP